VSRRVIVATVASGPDAANRALFAMSVAAELCGLHPQTLRTYERRGLLNPSRTAGGTRRYSEADLALIRRISELSTIGMSLEGIELVLSLETELDTLRGELARLRSRAESSNSGTLRFGSKGC
jgi:MerR family transcriptional regulator, heat shock protein HspR